MDTPPTITPSSLSRFIRFKQAGGDNPTNSAIVKFHVIETLKVTLNTLIIDILSKNNLSMGIY
ncbi:hypothetical protein A141_06615 [Vibrio crassostreae ZF-91]|nr:hypothetical protein A141_06615 [Vibrio crassostreae ZF-91]